MTNDIESIITPGKYAIDKKFREINYQLQQFDIVVPYNIPNSNIKRVKLGTKIKYNESRNK
jgi:hypothetical protein